MLSKNDKSVDTFSAAPCLVTPCEICTPMAAIFRSPTQTPVLPGTLPYTQQFLLSCSKRGPYFCICTALLQLLRSVSQTPVLQGVLPGAQQSELSKGLRFSLLPFRKGRHSQITTFLTGSSWADKT